MENNQRLDKLESDLRSLTLRVEKLEPKPPALGHDFLWWLDELDDTDLECITRGVDDDTLAMAMLELQSDHVAKIQPTVSKNRWKNLKEQMGIHVDHGVPRETILSCRRTILDFLDDLLRRGEISSPIWLAQVVGLRSIPHPTTEEQQAAKNTRKRELTDWFKGLQA